MKQSHKTKIIFIGCLVFGLLSFGVLVNPVRVFGQASVPIITIPSDVPCGHDCNNDETCMKATDTNTYECVSDSDVDCGHDCADGYSCNSTSKVCVPDNPANPATPANPNPANPNPPASNNSCPNGLTNINGLCLPPNQFTTGIASKTTLTDFILEVVKILLSFAGIIAVVMLVLGGYWYMAAGGNEEMSEKGKKTIINFVLGLVVIILAYTIVTVIASTLTGGDKLIQ